MSAAGRGPLVLFLHGIGGDRRHWFFQMEAFSGQYTAAAWDARGYGGSDDYEGPLDFSDFTRDVVRVIDHFRQDKAHLVGLSMGGRIARNVALAHPERVASLTLANSSPGFDALSADEVRRFVAERKARSPASLRNLLGSEAQPRAYEALLESFSALRQESYLKTLEASVAQDRAAPLESIRVPTLVITGSEDRVYSPALARDMARRIPGARLVEIEGAGHLTNLEQPGRFNQAVLEFLKEARS
ncbi:MAG TPA: alpha/beta fold hydrolase [Burkholderiales bacterium]|nr:alpha/beta fold hydrolase [Burkholderiales bacterium]